MLRVIGAGFALPRDAGRRPALLSRSPVTRIWKGASGCRRWFRAPARCRSETGAPFAVTRDEDLEGRSGLSALVSRSRAMPVGDRRSVSRSRVTRIWKGAPGCRRWFRAPARCRSETGAPFAVTRDEDLEERSGSSALVSRSRAMPVGDRRCVSRSRVTRIWKGAPGCRRWFRAAARCRSETGAPFRGHA